MSSYSSDELHKILKNDILQHFCPIFKGYRIDKLERGFLHSLPWEKRVPMFRVRKALETNLENVSSFQDLETLIHDLALLRDYGVRQLSNPECGKPVEKFPTFIQNYENILENLGYTINHTSEFGMQSLNQALDADLVTDIVYNLHISYVEVAVIRSLYRRYITQVGFDAECQNLVQRCIQYRKAQIGGVSWLTYMMIQTKNSASHSSTSDFQSIMPCDDHDSPTHLGKLPSTEFNRLPEPGTRNSVEDPKNQCSSPDILESPPLDNVPRENPFEQMNKPEEILSSISCFRESTLASDDTEDDFISLNEPSVPDPEGDGEDDDDDEDEDSDIDGKVDLPLPSTIRCRRRSSSVNKSQF